MGTALTARIPLADTPTVGRAATAELPRPSFLRDSGLVVGEIGIELAGERVQTLVGPPDPAAAQCPPGHGFSCCG